MRALLCHCHHHLEAEDDDALCAVVREHLIWWHPSLEPSEGQVQRIVSTRAYNIEYAEDHIEEELAFDDDPAGKQPRRTFRTTSRT